MRKTAGAFKYSGQNPAATERRHPSPGHHGRDRKQQSVAVGEFSRQCGKQVPAPDRILLVQKKGQRAQCAEQGRKTSQPKPAASPRIHDSG